MRVRRILAALLVLLVPLPALGADWITKGGSPERQSVSTAPLGLMQATAHWRLELGESATQPIVIGQDIYHLAGPYLWKVHLREDGSQDGPPEALGNGFWPEAVNSPNGAQHLVSQSTPTYSPDSKVIYFGTAFGRLWAYYVDRHLLRRVDITLGCPIVGSPLVLRGRGVEVVVIADRPNFPGEKEQPGRPVCPREHGKLWVITGLNRADAEVQVMAYNGPTTKETEDGFGGFITPAAVPGLPIDLGPTVVLGTDGFEGGRAMGFVLDQNEGYFPHRLWSVDGPAGFPGSFTSDGNNAYWLDTEGRLWSAMLKSGRPIDSWPQQSIDLPALIGASQAFTNTEPAVEVRPDGTHLYITLRNYTFPGGPPLRDGPTGADGAVVALDPRGSLKWYRLFGPADRAGASYASLNTAPLALTQRDTLLFGDVNGRLHSYALDSANPAGGHLQPFALLPGSQQAQSILSLLGPGEEPAHGPFNFSQVSGVGVEPAVGNGLVLLGVNYVDPSGPGGRLVAYRLGRSFNLRWADPPPAEPLLLQAGEPVSLANRVELQLAQESLGQLCSGPVAVQWYLLHQGQFVRRLTPDSPIPGSLASGTPLPLTHSVTLQPDDPDQGEILGVIDHPGLLSLAGQPSHNALVGQAVQIGQAAGLAPGLACSDAAEQVRLAGDLPGTGLMDNLIYIPYKKATKVDDPYIAGLSVPEETMVLDRFPVTLHLGYWTNQGTGPATVRYRIWARSSPDAAAPGGLWTRAVLEPNSCCLSLPVTFAGLPQGTWEIVAEVDYPGDTSPGNNQQVRQVVIGRPPENELPGAGGAITR